MTVDDECLDVVRCTNLAVSEHVAGQALLAGERGRSATQMTSLALAFHAGKAKQGSVLIFDRHASTQTQAWLLSTGKTVEQADDEAVDRLGLEHDGQSKDT
jgi:hypothetical protein